MAVSKEDFIKAWQTSATTKEVSYKLKIKPGTCAARASVLRKKGVPLKKFSSGRYEDPDYKALARLAQSLVKD